MSTRGRSERPVGSEGNRNKRMLASIQSTLGGRPARSGPRTRLQAKKENVEQLDGLDDVITQISDLTLRSDRSAIQIKRNIRGCQYLNHMTEVEWETLCKVLCETALQQSETDFVVDLFGSLLEESNPILYTTVNIIKGWLMVINGSHDEQNKKERASPRDEDDSASISSLESASESHQETEYEDEESTNPVIVNRCAIAVSELCASTQRSLWMKWPTLCDEIYAAIKPAITHNTHISGYVKSALLSTLISLHLWTHAKAATTTCTSTQTTKD